MGQEAYITKEYSQKAHCNGAIYVRKGSNILSSDDSIEQKPTTLRFWDEPVERFYVHND